MTEANLDYLGQSDWRKRIYQLKQEFRQDTTRAAQFQFSQTLTYTSQKSANPASDKPTTKEPQPNPKPYSANPTQTGARATENRPVPTRPEPTETVSGQTRIDPAANSPIPTRKSAASRRLS